ncbi:MAG: hypothetical protein A2Y76_12610 [Planctomycetes bacterium RBG_13_60_9]|nr:MAG: hypothetical protein A2Y76_12610 [Planctomycetes bacterium RBG_13_60_9]
MAQIILSGREIVGILRANELIPEQVLDVTTDGDEVRLRVRTPWPIVKSIQVGMRFAGFEDDCVVLQLATNRVMDKLDWLADKMVEPLGLEEHGGRWEYPRLYLNVNRLVQRQLRGVTVESIVFRDGLFHVTTVESGSCSASGRADPEVRPSVG